MSKISILTSSVLNRLWVLKIFIKRCNPLFLGWILKAAYLLRNFSLPLKGTYYCLLSFHCLILAMDCCVLLSAFPFPCSSLFINRLIPHIWSLSKASNLCNIIGMCNILIVGKVLDWVCLFFFSLFFCVGRDFCFFCVINIWFKQNVLRVDFCIYFL